MNTYQQRKQKLMAYYKKFKHMPTYDEVLHIFNLKSKGSLHKYLAKFFEDGFLKKSASGKLLPTPHLYGLKVLGNVQAGFPSAAEEELVDTLSLDEFLIKNPTASFMLEVNGDSMKEAGIMEGDLVIIEKGKEPKHGDIVVAEVDQDWTLKYYMKEKGNIFLRAANKKYSDIFPQSELKVGGIVTSVIRKYA